MTAIHQLVLVLAAGTLIGWAWPVAVRVSGALSEALLVCTALAGAAAVIWTLALGLIGLSNSPVALAAGPVLAWLAVTFAAHRGILGPRRGGDWNAGWATLAGRDRLLVGASLGLGVGAVLTVGLSPGFGIDAVEYHLPTALGWLHSGRAGSAQFLNYNFPVGYYPLTTEVLLSWWLALSASFAPMALIGPLTAGLGGLGLWRTLDLLGVRRGQVWLALAAYAVLPTTLFGVQSTGPGTDLAAVAWMLCGIALALGAAHDRRPLLLAPAVVADGMAVGTKTTVVPLMVIVLGWVLWQLRNDLPGLLRSPARSGSLMVALIAGGIVGLTWYVRNWIVHGWPLWPFSVGPTGSAMPHAMKLFAVSFLSRPRATVDASRSAYLQNLGGGAVLVLGALGAPFVARRRAVLVASVIAVVALLAWAEAPFTGLAANPLLSGLAITTVRYVLSALLACLVAVSLLARRGASAWVRRSATAVTLAAIGLSLWADVELGSSVIPRPLWPLVLAAVGIAVVAALPWGQEVFGRVVAGRDSARLTGLGRAGIVLCGLLAAALAWLAAPGWLTREARSGGAQVAVTAFMDAQPSFSRSSAPVSLAPAEIATLAGPRLRHPLELIPPRESCPRTLDRLAGGWIVLQPTMMGHGILTDFRSPSCLAHVAPVFSDGGTVVYAPRSEARG